MSESSIEVTLREITKDNWRDLLRLKVAPSQEQFVASNAMSIAEAHFNPEVAWFRAIYAGDVPVGFLMLRVMLKFLRFPIVISTLNTQSRYS
jgi:diamine N-acetyltransferase